MIGGSAGFASESTETDETVDPKKNLMLIMKNDERSGQVHQETLECILMKGKKRKRPASRS
jgi:hypothetical protein